MFSRTRWTPPGSLNSAYDTIKRRMVCVCGGDNSEPYPFYCQSFLKVMIWPEVLLL